MPWRVPKPRHGRSAEEGVPRSWVPCLRSRRHAGPSRRTWLRQRSHGTRRNRTVVHHGRGSEAISLAARRDQSGATWLAVTPTGPAGRVPGRPDKVPPAGRPITPPCRRPARPQRGGHPDGNRAPALFCIFRDCRISCILRSFRTRLIKSKAPEFCLPMRDVSDRLFPVLIMRLFGQSGSRAPADEGWARWWAAGRSL
jgi:hypothetical protein